MDFFYPPDLPISSSIEDISNLVERHQVVVIAGETGSGKTTQLPKVCRQLFPDSQRLVGCTQPRRVAALTVADRVRQELGPDGYLVGSKIRFLDRTSERTRIKFMTDGVLLAETKQDPLLTNYDAIIVDEAHERNLNIDFLLGYLHKLLPRRPDLKVVVTSATLDTEAFARHFHDAPVFHIEGRTYPVTVVYAPAAQDEEDLSAVEQCVECISSLCLNHPPGDILAFLPTEKDIRSCCEILAGRVPNRLVLPLFGKLQPSDQQNIFKNHPGYKIVVATNVAETSVTVPGIRYVVDSGLARISSYNARTRTTSLPVTRISQASCNQRTGRAGRLGPGTCFRLFSEEDFQSRPEFSVPEIQRSNLAEVILQMVALKLGDPRDFPFLDPPKPAAIREGYKTLKELGAITGANRLTADGTLMTRLPIDPVISRVIIEAARRGCLAEIIVIASALAIQDPRVRPADKEDAADTAHRKFSHPQSDFLVLLTIWKRYHDDHPSFSWSSLKRFCRDHYLSFQRMREWLDLHEQLSRILKNRKGFSQNSGHTSYEAIHRSLLTGFFRQCARRTKGAVYQAIGSRDLMIFPGSQQYGKSGEWIMAGSYIETSRLFALTVATIEPEWLEAAAAPFCSYSWTNSRWQKKTGRVVADETAMLDGLVITSGRTVNFPKRSKKNVPEARKIFIQGALVEDGLQDEFPFHRKNNELIAHWRQAEHTLRKRGIVIEEAGMYAFYDERLPRFVCDRLSLIKYLRKHGDDRLCMTEEDVVLNRPDDRAFLDFPPVLRHGGLEIPLRYCFSPGSTVDGITAVVPVSHVDLVKPEVFDWLVPGLLEEKATCLLKGLPKRVRKKLIPVNVTVARVLDELEPYRTSFIKAFSAALAKLFNVRVTAGDWPESLPNHLRMSFSVVDEKGAEIVGGDDWSEILETLHRSPNDSEHCKLRAEDEQFTAELAERIYTDWDFQDIPARLPLVRRDGSTCGYLFAALQAVPENHGVRVRYFASRDEARSVNTAGTHFLVQLRFGIQFKQLGKYCRVTLSGPSSVWLLSHFGGRDTGCSSMVRFIMNNLIDDDFQDIADRHRFETMVERVAKAGLYRFGKSAIDTVLSLLRQRKEVYDLIRKYEERSSVIAADDDLFADLYRHLERILPADFLARSRLDDLDRYSRYLRALSVRTERAYSNPNKDMLKRRQLAPHRRNLESFIQKNGEISDECVALLREYRNVVEEFSVSLFAPEIKTSGSVSEKIVRQAWRTLTAAC